MVSGLWLITVVPVLVMVLGGTTFLKMVVFSSVYKPVSHRFTLNQSQTGYSDNICEPVGTDGLVLHRIGSSLDRFKGEHVFSSDREAQYWLTDVEMSHRSQPSAGVRSGLAAIDEHNRSWHEIQIPAASGSHSKPCQNLLLETKNLSTLLNVLTTFHLLFPLSHLVPTSQ
ncbi:unnamed protein product [Lactuca saligna]|uniref:Uncharacterized protein n=1 Tax=Lactuca saligna TaxID=75948 RepID=A0AA35VPY8_LACSI|nr:unnamed protein product [Lactuca saligna]